jgi:hypothetical protein
MISLVKVSDVLAATAQIAGRAPQSIDTNDDSATAYWAGRLNVSTQDLFAAIQEVGPSVAAIRRHLNK